MAKLMKSVELKCGNCGSEFELKIGFCIIVYGDDLDPNNCQVRCPYQVCSNFITFRVEPEFLEDQEDQGKTSEYHIKPSKVPIGAGLAHILPNSKLDKLTN